jgi:hypothetical protein
MMDKGNNMYKNIKVMIVPNFMTAIIFACLMQLGFATGWLDKPENSLVECFFASIAGYFVGSTLLDVCFGLMKPCFAWFKEMK